MSTQEIHDIEKNQYVPLQSKEVTITNLETRKSLLSSNVRISSINEWPKTKNYPNENNMLFNQLYQAAMVKYTLQRQKTQRVT